MWEIRRRSSEKEEQRKSNDASISSPSVLFSHSHSRMHQEERDQLHVQWVTADSSAKFCWWGGPVSIGWESRELGDEGRGREWEE